MSSIKRSAWRRMKSGQEVPRQLIIACGDSTEVLEFAEEVLNEMAGFVKLLIVLSSSSAFTPRRNDDLNSDLFQRLNDTVVGVIGLVGDHRAGAQMGQQNIGASCAWPGVSKNRVGLPRASVNAWILVDNPPRDRPIACWFGSRPPGAVLMSANDGTVDHDVFRVGLLGQYGQQLGPDAFFRPPAEPAMNVAEVAVFFRKVTPGNPVRYRYRTASINRRLFRAVTST